MKESVRDGDLKVRGGLVSSLTEYIQDKMHGVVILLGRRDTR